MTMITVFGDNGAKARARMFPDESWQSAANRAAAKLYRRGFATVWKFNGVSTPAGEWQFDTVCMECGRHPSGDTAYRTVGTAQVRVPCKYVTANDLNEKPSGPIVQLECSCCGEYIRARQWWNQDEGYGLCNRCAAYIQSRGTYSPESFIQTYGRDGIHYNIPGVVQDA